MLSRWAWKIHPRSHAHGLCPCLAHSFEQVIIFVSIASMLDLSHPQNNVVINPWFPRVRDSQPGGRLRPFDNEAKSKVNLPSFPPAFGY